MSPPSARSEFTVSITCPECNQTGTVRWEEDDGRTAGNVAARILVHLSNGFRSEEGRTQSGDPMIVCDKCGCIQPD